MRIQLIFAAMLALTAVESGLGMPASAWGPEAILTAALAAPALAGGVAALLAWAVSSRGRLPAWWGGVSQGLLLAAFAGLVFGMGWADQVRQWAAETTVPRLVRFAVLMPYVAMLPALWLAELPFVAARAAAEGRVLRRRAYLMLRLRTEVLPTVAGLAVVTAVLQGIESFTGEVDASAPAWVVWAGLGVTIVLMMGLAPMVAAAVLPTEPLDPGPMADRLAAGARRFGLRLSGVRVWLTDMRAANAAVLGGLGGWVRVLMSDRLLATLTPAQVDAVFAHEAAHVRCRHRWFAAAGGMGAFLLTGDVLGMALSLLSAGGMPAGAAALVALPALAAGATVMVLLMRMFELEADHFAVRHLCSPEEGCIGGRPGWQQPGEPPPWEVPVPGMPCPRTHPAAVCMAAAAAFSSGFVRVAGEAYGGRLDAGDLLHGTALARLRQIERFVHDPEAEVRFTAKVRAAKVAAVLAFGAAIALSFAGG